MTFKEFLNLIDPEKAGIAWILISDEFGYIECKINSGSSFCVAFYEKTIIKVKALAENEFGLCFEAEKEKE